MRFEIGKNWILAGVATVALGCGAIWVLGGDGDVQPPDPPRERPVRVVITDEPKAKPTGSKVVSNTPQPRPPQPVRDPVNGGGREKSKNRTKPAAIKVIPKAG